MKKETTYIFDVHDIEKALEAGKFPSEIKDGYPDQKVFQSKDDNNILIQTVKMLRGYRTLFKMPKSHESILLEIETYFEGYAPQTKLMLSIERYNTLKDIAYHLESIFKKELIPRLEYAAPIRITPIRPPFNFLVSVFNLPALISDQKNSPSDSGTGASVESGTESSGKNNDLIVEDSNDVKKENEFFDFAVTKTSIRGLPSMEDMKSLTMNSYIWTLSDDNDIDGVEFTTNDFCQWVSEEFGIKIETLEEWRALGGQRIRRRCSSVLCNLAENEKLVRLCRGRFSVPKEEDFLGEAVVGFPEMVTFGDR